MIAGAREVGRKKVGKKVSGGDRLGNRRVGEVGEVGGRIVKTGGRR